MHETHELTQARELGRLAERSAAQASDILDMKGMILDLSRDVRSIRDTQLEMKGAWKFGLKAAAGAGALTGFISALLGMGAHR